MSFLLFRNVHDPVRLLYCRVNILIHKRREERKLYFIQLLHSAALAVERPEVFPLRLEGIVQQRQQHIARHYRKLMVEAEYPLRGLVGIARIADAVKDRAEPFKLGYIVLLEEKEGRHRALPVIAATFATAVIGGTLVQLLIG